MSDMPYPLFADLNLSAPLLRVLQELGYETPSPIQAGTIPVLLGKRDVLGQAQTGTGKTAAFALPILAGIDIRQQAPQAMVLAPTRELAIQVAEAFQRYATYIPGFHVLPIYGGQSYGPQLSALRRGVHVVVGTPGRVIDHLDKGSLDLSQIKTLVLDEADEMLRMGFIDDVETILRTTPASRQTALFSATMPPAIRRIAQTYLRDPAEITIAAKTGTAENIQQRYWLVSGMHKLDALTRILEAESFDGMIIFTRTKVGTEELAGKLQARGFAAAAINGDLGQQQRERTIGQLKDGKIDILVATDVAARGLDVERISHVINYDVPLDPESYTHRIGRTGRAGRSGEAILFISPRERNLLKAIERATRQPISRLDLPSIQDVNDVRIARFKEQISTALAAGSLETYQSLIEDYERENNVPAIEIAAALAKLARGDMPLLLEPSRHETREERSRPDEQFRTGDFAEHRQKPGRERRTENDQPAFPRREPVNRAPDMGMARFRIEVGHAHAVKPGNIVGAIANEAGLDSRYIGRIEIYDDHSTIDLPDDLPPDLLAHLKKVWVAGQQLRIRREDESTDIPSAHATEAAGAAKSRDTNETFTGRTSANENSGHARSPRQERRGADAMTEETVAPAKGRADRKSKIDIESYRIEVGHAHGVKPANIVGAIANEVGLDAQYIGRIEMFDDYSVVDLPTGMPKALFKHLQTVKVAGHLLRISHAGDLPLRSEKRAGKDKAAPVMPRKPGEHEVNKKAAGKREGIKSAERIGKRADNAAKTTSAPHRKGPKAR